MKKPLSIIILSFMFFLSPIVILVFNSALNMVPLIGYGSIIFRLHLFDIFILFLYIISGISVFMVRKWGWWIIISSALIMFVYNVISFYRNPFASLMILLLMNFALFAVTLTFFRKHLIAPYFNPQLRWWKQDQRYKIDIYLKFIGMNKNVIISDLSEGGCYIFIDFLIETGVTFPILIVCGSFQISVQAKIMRIAKESERYFGYGLMFQKIEEVEKAGLNKLLKKLQSFSQYDINHSDSDDMRKNIRYKIGYNLFILSQDETCPANLLDLSISGCSVRSSSDLEINSTCIFNYTVEEQDYRLISKVVWRKGESGGSSYGLKFVDSDKTSRKALKKMISNASRLGAGKRKISRKEYYKQCEETLDHTPYELIRFLKKLIFVKTG